MPSLISSCVLEEKREIVHRHPSQPSLQATAMAPVKAIVFDVNETMFSMSTFADKFQRLGLSAVESQLWFLSVLRDGLSLAASGGFASLRDIGIYHAQRILQSNGRSSEDSQQGAEQVVAGFQEVRPHEDVAEGLAALASLGIQLSTMTNGSKAVTKGFLDRADIGSFVKEDDLMDVAQPQIWKPAPGAYTYAVKHLRCSPDEVLLVAVHPWDCNGAKAAGLQAAYINRSQQPYPSFMRAPDMEATSLVDLAAQLKQQLQT